MILPYFPIPKVRSGAAALLSVDHCFSVKGQGTVMTGTVLQVIYCTVGLETSQIENYIEKLANQGR